MKWSELKQKIEAVAREALSEENLRQAKRDFERVRAEVEREVTMLRQELREQGKPAFDDTQALKAKLDAARSAKR